MSAQTHQNAVAIFDVNQAGSAARPYILAGIMGADKKFHQIKLLADSGNDVTLINDKSAAELGFDRAEVKQNSQPFKVQGIANDPLDFYMIKSQLRLKDLEPVWIKIGIGPVRENLLGREDVLDNFTVTTSKKQVIFTQLHSNQLGLYARMDSDAYSGIRSYIPSELLPYDRTRVPQFGNVR